MSTTTRTRGGVCQDWNNRIQAERRELDRLQRELDGNVARLKELEQAPHPDLAQIAALKARITVLKARVEELTAGIVAEEADYEFFCG
ncbi:hypothetical protein [Taklimakanibacter deserti]|uniref:hypothetical protein n=1 Tax=Taklimakanibacter deserti TaxID=2267839 RepID=UPI000E64E7EB